MEQSCSRSDSLLLDFNENEDFQEVASILLQLKQLIEFRDRSKELIGCRNRAPFFPIDWGPVPKRRRSAEEKLLVRGGCLPSPQVAAVAGDPVVAPGKGDDEVESASPVTPFSFSPSDTDENSGRLKRKISNSGTGKEEDERNEIQLKENGEIRMMNDSDEKPRLLKRKISDKAEEMVEIPDLNIPIQIDGVDDSKSSTKAAMAAAEARRRRIRILREKRYKLI